MYNKLVVFDLANNHMGDVNHGLKIIRAIREVITPYDFKFAFKFQYRQLDSGFIHPDYTDNFTFKYIKRFQETKLSREDTKRLKDEVNELGFISICTPFDEKSVDLIVEQGFDIIKIASCSFLDWNLLEKIAETNLPIIASTAGASLEDIDKVVAFLSNRKKDFALMHCIAEYPTKNSNLNLNQIDLLKNRYNVPIGFSTHEDPDNIDAVKIAVAKGASILERHVSIDDSMYTRNSYSSTPEQIDKWLYNATLAYEMCGVKDRYEPLKSELESLHGLKRGVFVNKDIYEGETINIGDYFLAIPIVSDTHLVSDNMSKYSTYIAVNDLKKNQPVCGEDVTLINTRQNVLNIINEVKTLFNKSKVAISSIVDLEISHHYGIDKFYETGAVILNCINTNEYCKKLLVLLPKQSHPEHYHVKKHETFQVLYGDLTVDLGDSKITLLVGDIFSVDRGVKHSFCSENGCIFEEVSTTSYKDDSFYTEPIFENRKTRLLFYSDWLTREII